MRLERIVVGHDRMVVRGHLEQLGCPRAEIEVLAIGFPYGSAIGSTSELSNLELASLRDLLLKTHRRARARFRLLRIDDRGQIDALGRGRHQAQAVEGASR